MTNINIFLTQPRVGNMYKAAVTQDSNENIFLWHLISVKQYLQMNTLTCDAG